MAGSKNGQEVQAECVLLLLCFVQTRHFSHLLEVFLLFPLRIIKYNYVATHNYTSEESLILGTFKQSQSLGNASFWIQVGLCWLCHLVVFSWGLRVDKALMVPYMVVGCRCCLAIGHVAVMLGRRGIRFSLFHDELIPLLQKTFSVNVRIQTI